MDLIYWLRGNPGAGGWRLEDINGNVVAGPTFLISELGDFARSVGATVAMENLQELLP